MVFKSRLPELMKSQGVDQKTLAKETGLNPGTIGKMYRGHFTRIDCRTIEILLKRFGLASLCELIEIDWSVNDE